ncbi:PF20097 family protein [Sphingomonas koreensis]
MRSNPCPKCQGSMTEGFILTERSSVSTLLSWSRGTPRKRWWGVKSGEGKPIEISASRCQRCGFLENYARN